MNDNTTGVLTKSGARIWRAGGIVGGIAAVVVTVLLGVARIADARAATVAAATVQPLRERLAVLEVTAAEEMKAREATHLRQDARLHAMARNVYRLCLAAGGKVNCEPDEP